MTAPMPRPRASHPRPLRGNVGPRRGTPPTDPQVASSQVPRSPAPPPARGRSNGAVSDSPMVSRFRPKIAPDSPRVMPETACNS